MAKILHLAAAVLAVLTLAAAPLAAQMGPSLMGRTVTLKVLTYDDRNAPLYESASHSAKVTDATEFGLRREGVQNDIDVVPILIDVEASRIEFDYSIAEPGELAEAKFNGYVLDFGGDCNLFWGARVDRDFSTFPMTENRIFFDKGTLYVDVSGMTFDRESRFAIDLDLSGCGTA
ncbi:MAG: hypothetical protein KDJ86_06185 [Bauldia sp.]|uniref:hypothetical protein n=1 Tax=Bauldia sp. TaxID=2575872 RepID=UPI001E07E365|nr:hypothetical protein [Bauldia sp.]MCB1495353.1 hypothetical protein [Bauldia sp.]